MLSAGQSVIKKFLLIGFISWLSFAGFNNEVIKKRIIDPPEFLLS